MQVTGSIVQSNPPEFLKTFKNVFLSQLITAFRSIFRENLFLECEIVHQVLKISKTFATSLQFGK